MDTPKEIFQFAEAKNDTIENLEAIKLNLSRCVDEGMIDLSDVYYNQLLDLENEAHISESWEELIEVVDQAKILEVDVDVWMANHGRTTISLTWPKRPAS